MSRRSLLLTIAVAAVAVSGMSTSVAFAKEAPVKTRVTFTAEYAGGEYFGESNTLHCKGVHKTNSVKFPGSGSRGGMDVEVCTLSKGETFPSRWQVVGQPINIDDNYWRSDFDGQEVPFNEDLPAYGVSFSKVLNDHSFRIKVIYPNT